MLMKAGVTPIRTLLISRVAQARFFVATRRLLTVSFSVISKEETSPTMSHAYLLARFAGELCGMSRLRADSTTPYHRSRSDYEIPYLAGRDRLSAIVL